MKIFPIHKQYIHHVNIKILKLKGLICSFVDAAILTSEVFGISDDPNDVCLQDRVVYTCTVPDVLSWTVQGVQLGAYIRGQANIGDTRGPPSELPGVEANLTEVDGTTLTSTLTISSAGMVVNGSMIVCQGFLQEDVNRTVLRHRGEIHVL